jgi:hypothetical protein
MNAPPPEDDAVGSASTGTSGLRPIRVGARVRSTNATPVFASDAQLGDRGTVVQTSEGDGSTTVSYLVRWDGGAESWSTREHLEPSGRGALGPSTMSTQGPSPGPGAGPGPGPGPGPGDSPSVPRRAPSPGARNLQRVLPFVFILFAGQGLIRALVQSARHPGIDTALLALAILAIAFAAYQGIRRRGRSRRRGPRGPTA